jgi:hypothetical protein
MARLFWTQRQHVGPAPRRGHTLAFDSARARVVLFGGVSAGAPFGDTWEWDGESWTQMNDIGPSARAGAAMAYDAARRRTVLFGGADAVGTCGDTWEWDGEDWTQVADDGPAARDGAALAYDASRPRILLFGGRTSTAPAMFSADSWEWDGEAWVQVQDTGPAPRSGHALAFDTPRGRAVLYGGADDARAFGDTWEWDRGTWRQAAGFGPPELAHATLIFNGRRCVLFGGASAPGSGARVFGMTWEWDGRHWTARQDMGPGPRHLHAMAFDSARQRGVLFGGASDLASPPATHGDTWEQFERGTPLSPPTPAPAPVPGTARLSLAVSPATVREGEALTLDFGVAPPAAAAARVTWTIRTASGPRIGDEMQTPIDAGSDRGRVVFPAALPPGSYLIAATLDALATEAPFTVVVNDRLQLVRLGAPATAAAGQPVDIEVEISGPAPDGFGVLLTLANPGASGSARAAVPVPAGTTRGALRLGEGAGGLPVGTWNFSATLGGVERSATVQVL